MTASRLYFVRHGESAANVQRRFANRGDGPGLTALGRRQAAQVAQSLAGYGVEHLYASPLLRARQTARVLAQRLGVPMVTTEALREYDVGDYEGTTDQAHWDAQACTETAWLLHGRTELRTGGGESYTDIERRFVPLVERLSAAPATATVLVGHGGLYRVILPRVLANVSASFAHDHPLGHTDRVVARVDDGRLTCTEWGGPF